MTIITITVIIAPVAVVSTEHGVKTKGGFV